MRTAAAFALIVILAGMLWRTEWPRCTATSPHGPRIGGAILIEGCP